jgi:hypothetical protein
MNPMDLNRGIELGRAARRQPSWRQCPVADAVESAHTQFAGTRQRLPLNPPDGFRIVDRSGNELAHWFGAAHQQS